MLKIVYPICCGMDVHKNFVVACIATTDDKGVTTYKKKTVLYLYLRFAPLCVLACRKQLHRCLYGIHRQVLDSCLQHFGIYLSDRPCPSQICESNSGQENRRERCQVDRGYLQARFGIRSFIPPADIRQLRDLMRYRWKLTHYTVGEKNRAQNCLTVSNIKLDDVFSDVFGKTASAITDRLLESNEPFDVAPYLSRRVKTPVEKIQAAVDGELCAEQAEKLRIIRSHMNSLDLCKANLESLILSTAQKFLPQLELVMTVPGIQAYSAIGIISKLVWICPCSHPRSTFAPGLALRRRTTRAQERRKPPESAEQGRISSLCWYSVRLLFLRAVSTRKSGTAILP